VYSPRCNYHHHNSLVVWHHLVDYVPVGGSRSCPCFPDDVKQPRSPDDDEEGATRPAKLKANFKLVEMSWFDEHGVRVPSAGVKSADVPATPVYVNSRKNLALKNARPENTGRYLCVATATVANDSQITVVNVLRINGQLHQPIK